jgi:selenocysteine-specific elongation factor
LSRRGAAAARTAHLERHGSDLAAELEARGAVRGDRLRRLGVPLSPLPEGAVSAGRWLVSARQAEAWRARLAQLVEAADGGLAPAEAARALGLPDLDLVELLVAEPVRRRGGRLVVHTELPAPLRNALEALRAELGDAPFQAPGADRLAELGLDRAALGRLARAGDLLVVGDGVALLPGTDAAAAEVLATLPQPFTTSQARQALGTSRRVVLPLLAHLDRSGRTVRLPDDTRRVR